ncbi:MAG: GerMN domain-containing protein [Patescibacteria group bacterium]|nr:GerMN domain-containing protein [Patescibacteria group bacterium]
MKRILIYLVALIIIVFLAIINLRLISGPEDTWLCQNGEWVAHGKPSNPPVGVCLKHNPIVKTPVATTTENQPTADNVASEINITSPTSNQIITSPLEITGQAKGTWYFEASFPIKLIGDKGEVLAQVPATAQADWMTTDFVPFKATLSFNPGSSTIGMLVFANDNPSGMPQNEKQFGVPVRLSAVEQMPVKIYFGNTDLNKNTADCSLVFSVERLIAKTQTTARASLEQLLAGATDAEKAQGYFTSINPGVKINSLTIKNGTAKVDFDSQIEYQLGGSCRVAAIRAQITQTLEQFPTVKNVIISVNGNVGEALQP